MVLLQMGFEFVQLPQGFLGGGLVIPEFRLSGDLL